MVEDAQGAVLPAATVSLTDTAGQTAATAVGDKDGRYKLAVPPGTYTLVADARSGGTPVRVTVTGVTVGAATPLDVVIAGLPSGLVHFRGRLVDPGGSPISGTAIGLGSDIFAVTDSGGNFDLAVPPNVYDLSVSGFGSGEPYVTAPGFDVTRDRVGDITVAFVTQDVTVYDTSGAPAERSFVTLWGTSTPGAGSGASAGPFANSEWSSSGTTDAGGHVQLSGLASPSVRVQVSPRGRTDQEYNIEIDGRHSTNVLVTVAAPSSLIRLSGTSTQSDGVTPAEPHVSLSGPNGTPIYSEQAVYYPEAGPGAFTVDALDGTYTLKFSSSVGSLSPWEGGDPSGDEYSLSSEQFRHDQARSVAFRLPAGPDLTVRIVDPQGAPVAGAVLTATSDAPAESNDVELAPGLLGAGTLRTTRVTDANGVATLRTLPGHPPTSVHVAAPSERGLDGDFAVPAAASSFDVHLQRGVVLSGTMRVGGSPGSPAWHVTLVSKDGKVRRPITVGADGTYRVSVAPGTYRLVTDFDDNEPGGQSDDHWNAFTNSSTFAVTGDRRLDLSFPARSGASVRFVGADGKPLEGEIFLASTSAPGALTLAPGITTTASAGFSAFGARDEAGIDTWPGGAIVSGVLDPPMTLQFSGIHLVPGGAAVVALAEGYSLPGSPPSPDASGPAAPDGTYRPSTPPGPSGYWALGADGKVYNFGSAPQLGNGAAGAVDLEPSPTGMGYWILNRNGTVAAFGDAVLFGSVDLKTLGQGEEPASLSATPSGRGYWVFTNRGRAIAFGDAPFLGDMSATKLNGPVLGSVATPSGKGYYMVASDGGIFAFGDAKFAGSMGGRKLNAPVQSLVPDADGSGYWLVASDGGIFAFDAPFRGSMGATHLNKPISGMVRYGDGYLMVGADGGIFNFSSLPFAGSLGDKPPASPVVAVAALPLA